MTDAEIVKLAAEKVMGWRFNKKRSSDEWQMWHFDVSGRCEIIASPKPLTVENWWPLTSIADAFMLIDAAGVSCDFTLERSGTNWTADFRTTSVTHTDRCRAITLAVLKAVGVEVE